MASQCTQPRQLTRVIDAFALCAALSCPTSAPAQGATVLPQQMRFDWAREGPANECKLNCREWVSRKWDHYERNAAAIRRFCERPKSTRIGRRFRIGRWQFSSGDLAWTRISAPWHGNHGWQNGFSNSGLVG